MKNYDVAIVGAGPGGIYAAYELMKKDPALSVICGFRGRTQSGKKALSD